VFPSGRRTWTLLEAIVGWLLPGPGRAHSGPESSAHQSLSGSGLQNRPAPPNASGCSHSRDGQDKAWTIPHHGSGRCGEATQLAGCAGVFGTINVCANCQQARVPQSVSDNRTEEDIRVLVMQHTAGVAVGWAGSTLLIRVSPGGEQEDRFGAVSPCSGKEGTVSVAFEDVGGP